MKQYVSILSAALIILGSAILAQVSLVYVHPADCNSICDDPIQAPCPQGSCRIGEQRAGFPFPMVVDRGGSSPTSGWGKIGPEDYFPPDFIALFLNILIYMLLLTFAWEFFLVLKNKRSRGSLLIKSPLLVIAIGALVYGYIRDSSYLPEPVRVTDSPQAALLGNWEGTDTVSGAAFLIRFYESGQLSILLLDRNRYGGDYTWINDDAIQVRLSSSGYAPFDYCTTILSIFQKYCTTESLEPFDPSAYPGPFEPVILAYPVPTEAPLEVAQVDARFSIHISEDHLTLTPMSGSPQVFHRMWSYPSEFTKVTSATPTPTLLPPPD